MYTVLLALSPAGPIVCCEVEALALEKGAFTLDVGRKRPTLSQKNARSDLFVPALCCQASTKEPDSHN